MRISKLFKFLSLSDLFFSFSSLQVNISSSSCGGSDKSWDWNWLTVVSGASLNIGVSILLFQSVGLDRFSELFAISITLSKSVSVLSLAIGV